VFAVEIPVVKEELQVVFDDVDTSAKFSVELVGGYKAVLCGETEYLKPSVG